MVFPDLKWCAVQIFLALTRSDFMATYKLTENGGRFPPSFDMLNYNTQFSSFFFSALAFPKRRLCLNLILSNAVFTGT